MRVDVRVPRAQAGTAVIGLDRRFTIEETDWSPPASGPEIEIRLSGTTTEAVETVLRSLGVSVLAIRSREEPAPRLRWWRRG